jgi:hypothetical protein
MYDPEHHIQPMQGNKDLLFKKKENIPEVMDDLQQCSEISPSLLSDSQTPHPKNDW